MTVAMPAPRAAPSIVLRALMLAYVAATAVHLGWVMAHEPFSFDAWNIAVDTGGRPFTFGRFLDYWSFEYTHSNPRIGQALTYLVYKLDYVAEILTPLAYLALTLAVTTLGLGRWPRRGRDLAMWAIAIGFGWLLPEIGRNMFCRAYGANYVYGAAIQLWFLVPLRLAARYDVSLRKTIAYGVFGLIAGLCNEHTGPALVTFLAGYAWWLHRAGQRGAQAPRMVWAGALGAALGFAALFFAPGQGERYDGLAQKVSLPMRMIQRGVTGNLDILRDYVIYAAPLLGLIVIVLITTLVRSPGPLGEARTRALRFIALALVAGGVLAATMFVSPKLGSRFYIVSIALLLAGFLALLDASAARPREWVPYVVLAVLASIYAGARTIPLFAKVAPQAKARMAALEATRPGDVFVADAWEQVDESWWFIGDDFRDVGKREMVATYFDLARVFFRGYDAKAPLGLLGVKYAPRYRTERGEGIDAAFELGVTKGFDIAGVHRATRASIEILRGRLQPERLTAFELGVEFAGSPPPLPAPKLVVARWHDGTYEGHTATIVRRARSTTRDVVLPKELAGTALEIYIVQVGGEVRRLGTAAEPAALHYVPWRSGVYWVLACAGAAHECWVVAATRQGG